jgi:hypothetical protein
MLDALRKPFLIVSVILLVIAVLAEVGSLAYLDAAGKNASQFKDMPTPGLGIAYLALLDGLLLFTLGMICAPLIIPQRIHGRIQGIVTLIVSLLTLISAIAMIFVAIGLLMLMVALFMAIPFGTIIYMAKFADFDTGAAGGTLGLIMSLKLGFAVFLVLAHQRFLQNKGLVLIVLTSFLATIIVSFLHGLTPGFLVSITDDIAAIIIAILAAIWSVIYLVGSIPSIIKVLRVDQSLK